MIRTHGLVQASITVSRPLSLPEILIPKALGSVRLRSGTVITRQVLERFLVADLDVVECRCYCLELLPF